MTRLKIHASRTGWPSGPRTRPLIGRARPEREVDVLADALGFEVEERVGVGVEPPVARLGIELPTLRAELPEHVIVAGALDDQVARTGRRHDLERAVGVGGGRGRIVSLLLFARAEL